MILDEIREKLQDIVRGARLQGTTDRCSTIRNILVESFGAGSTVKSEFESRTILKEKQAGFLKSRSKELELWRNRCLRVVNTSPEEENQRFSCQGMGSMLSKLMMLSTMPPEGNI